MSNKCIDSKDFISQDVYDYSIDKFGVPLCRRDQDWIRKSKATEEAIKLFLELRVWGVP